ncbi:MAG: NUDIX domain-containing protein [Acidimicrobiales bacterium]
MTNRKRRWIGRILRAVPTPIREFAVRRTTPSYIMGAMCRVERDDGRVLLVKPSYRTVWTLPGGVSERGETPIDCMRRELLEETGLRCDVIGEPVVMVDPKHRIFDFVYQARLAPGVSPDDARAVSLEITEVGWFEPGKIPSITGPFARKVFSANSSGDGRVVVVEAHETPDRGWRHRR